MGKRNWVSTRHMKGIQQVTTKLTRQENGRLLYEAGKVFELDEDKNQYWVESQDAVVVEGYKVNFNCRTCECKDYENRLQTCKHWYAVRDYKSVKIQNIMSGIQVKALSQVGEVVLSYK